MSDRLLALHLFARVARTESFSRAARELGLSQPSVSRIIAALESKIGAALLTRTTRGLSLTEAGSDYLSRIEPILAALDEADHAARGTGELRGVLRIALSTSFAMREVIPRLPKFMDRHPALRLDLLMSDQRQDLVNEGADVALRFGALADSTATSRRIGATSRVLAAAPAYLEKAGSPKTPADLSGHALIIGPAGSGSEGWTFERDGRKLTVRVEGRLKTTVNEAATAAATAGIGILSTARWGCHAELVDGRLVEVVLADWKLAPAEVNAIFPAGRAAKPAARAFAEYLASAMSEK
jgi:DNA-binding transcriptional LysR family regulator